MQEDSGGQWESPGSIPRPARLRRARLPLGAPLLPCLETSAGVADGHRTNQGESSTRLLDVMEFFGVFLRRVFLRADDSGLAGVDWSVVCHL